MGKVVKLSKQEVPTSIGYTKVKKRKRINLEDFGQLNLFTKETKLVHFNARISPFKYALELDDRGDVQAQYYYEEAIKLNDNAADAYCNLGVLYAAKDVIKAIDCFTRALMEDPRHYEAHFNLGNVYAEQGDLNLALLHYESSISIEPSFADAYYNLALLKIQKHSFAEALHLLYRYKLMIDEHEQVAVNGLIADIRDR